MRIVGVLRRVWIPLVVVVVIVCGGFAVSRIHGLYGMRERPSYANDRVDDAASSSNPKHMVYEVFGSAGSVADISYFDVDAQPQEVDGAALPWSITITAKSHSVVGSVAAQGDSDNIGCRIVVDGEVKDERIKDAVKAYTHCLVTNG